MEQELIFVHDGRIERAPLIKPEVRTMKDFASRYRSKTAATATRCENPDKVCQQGGERGARKILASKKALIKSNIIRTPLPSPINTAVLPPPVSHLNLQRGRAAEQLSDEVPDGVVQLRLNDVYVGPLRRGLGVLHINREGGARARSRPDALCHR